MLLRSKQSQSKIKLENGSLTLEKPDRKSSKRKLSRRSSDESDEIETGQTEVQDIKCEEAARKFDNNTDDDDDSDEDGEKFDISKHCMSEYELLRQKNMEENLRLFDDLNVIEAKQSLLPTKVLSHRPFRKKPKIDVSLPRRASLRIQNIEPVNYTYNTIPVITSTFSGHNYRERKPANINIKEECDEDEKSTLANLSELEHIHKEELELEPVSVDLINFKQKMKSLQVHYVCKVVPTRITSMVVHPIETKVLGFVADKRGSVALWDVESSDSSNHGIALFEPHSSPVNCMKFAPDNSNKLYSCSYDGTIRCCDLNQLTFTQIYGVPEDEDIRFNHFSSPKNDRSMFYIATSIGDIFQVDIRTGKLENTYNLYPKNIRCIDFHPKDDNIFVAACTNGSLATWDTRYLKEERNNSISDYRVSRTISGSFFSPQSGNKILATSQDDNLRIFDVNKTGEMSLRQQIRHDNYVTRWLTPFQADWVPGTDNCFVCGSMNRPRQVDMYGCGEKKNELCSFALTHPEYTTVTSRNVFHPTRNLFFSGNSSGKVLVWM